MRSNLCGLMWTDLIDLPFISYRFVRKQLQVLNSLKLLLLGCLAHFQQHFLVFCFILENLQGVELFAEEMEMASIWRSG